MQGGRFDLPIETARYWKHNKIVWVGPTGVPSALEGLVGDLHDRLRRDGFALEDRPFAAHVTLLRKAGVPPAIPPLPLIRWPADEFVLVRSRPDRDGSRYEIAERFPLK